MRGSKSKLSKNEKEVIEADNKTGTHARYLKVLELSKKISVDDVFMIKYRLWGDENWTLNMHPHTGIFADIPQKYIAVHKDIFGAIYFKAIFADGTYGNIEKIEDYYDPYNLRLIIDPDQLDAIMLDELESYNPIENLMKIKRELSERSKYNAKCIIHTNKFAEYTEFIDNMKVGDSVWVNNKTQYTCIKTEMMVVKDFIKKKYSTSYGKCYIHEFKNILKRKKIKMKAHVRVITYQTTSNRILTYSYLDAKNGRFYREQPMTSKKLKL